MENENCGITLRCPIRNSKSNAKEAKRWTKCTHMHVSISSLDAQCLTKPGDVSQEGHILVALTPHQNVQNPRTSQHYTNYINSIAAKTLREEKLVKKLLFILPCLASPPFYQFYPLLQSNKTSTVPTSFSLFQGNFVLPSLFSFLLIVFIFFFLHVFYSSSLFYISLFSYSPVSSLSPPQTHTHRLQTT